MTQKLRDSVTFLPLKDLRCSKQPLEGHTWFMISMYDTREEGDVQHQQFPSESSKSRILCPKGRDTHDGSWNYCALAWPEALASNATLMKNGCEVPTRWILYHWGELRVKMGTRLNTLMAATFDQAPHVEGFNEITDNDQPVCFGKAVVMRHNEGGMPRERRMEVYDLIRCKVRVYCNASLERSGDQKT